jgi:hypothetical protein
MDIFKENCRRSENRMFVKGKLEIFSEMVIVVKRSRPASHMCDAEEVIQSQFLFDLQSHFRLLLCDCCRERTQLSIFLPIENTIMDIFIKKCRKSGY